VWTRDQKGDVVVAVFEMDDYEGEGGILHALAPVLRGLIIAGVVVGPLIIGGLLGWTATLMLDQSTLFNSSGSLNTADFTELELRAVGLSPNAVSGILLPRE
jgi:hypothetical protein